MLVQGLLLLFFFIGAETEAASEAGLLIGKLKNWNIFIEKKQHKGC